MKPGECGAREYLFLWSMALERGYPWPDVLETTDYNPYTDILDGKCGKPGVVGYSRFTFNVFREGSASCEILKSHGLSYEDIDKALRKWMNEA